jgi:hypothetical protein
MGTCLFVKTLFSNGSCTSIFATLAVVAQQRVYLLKYYVSMENTIHIVDNLYTIVIICNIIVTNTIILRVKAVGACIT